MSRFGDDYNPYGLDRHRFESRTGFDQRLHDEQEEDERRREAFLKESAQEISERMRRNDNE